MLFWNGISRPMGLLLMKSSQKSSSFTGKKDEKTKRVLHDNLNDCKSQNQFNQHSLIAVLNTEWVMSIFWPYKYWIIGKWFRKYRWAMIIKVVTLNAHGCDSCVVECVFLTKYSFK